jgi:L-fucono-1,5-lactonase
VTRIDAHQHFWRFDAARDAWITDDMAAIRRDFLPQHLAPLLRDAGFDGCIAVQADQSLNETRFLLELAHQHDFIRGVVGWVDLRAPDLGRTLEMLVQDPLFRGVRHLAQAEADDFLTRDAVVAGIGEVGRHDLTSDILVYAPQLPAAIALATRLDGQRLVLDHLAKPRIRERELEPWRSRLRELARRPNVWCKLSGLVTEADWAGWRPEDLHQYLDVALEAFGAQRVLFGSDWPVCLVAAGYDVVARCIEDFASALTSGEREALFGGSAIRCYALVAAAGGASGAPSHAGSSQSPWTSSSPTRPSS